MCRPDDFPPYDPHLGLLTDEEITEEYIALCRDEMNALGEASQELIQEALANGWYDEDRPAEERQADIDRRRAELYKQHLDAAGIEIRRKDPA